MTANLWEPSKMRNGRPCRLGVVVPLRRWSCIRGAWSRRDTDSHDREGTWNNLFTSSKRTQCVCDNQLSNNAFRQSNNIVFVVVVVVYRQAYKVFSCIMRETSITSMEPSYQANNPRWTQHHVSNIVRKQRHGFIVPDLGAYLRNRHANRRFKYGMNNLGKS